MICMKKFRRYIFAVVFIKDRKTKFLIFHRVKNWKGWELLKGGLKGNESEGECLRREIAEETGAKMFKTLSKTRHIIKYKWPREYMKDQHRFYGAIGNLYIVRLFDKKIKIDKREHDKFKWVDAKDALKHLTYLNQKNALKYVLKNHNL